MRGDMPPLSHTSLLRGTQLSRGTNFPYVLQAWYGRRGSSSSSSSSSSSGGGGGGGSVGEIRNKFTIL